MCLIAMSLLPNTTHAQITVSASISASSDDAEEAGPDGTGSRIPGFMDLTSSDIELIRDFDTSGGYSGGTQKIGLRFTAMAIPPGATITSAYLTFRAIDADAPMTNVETTNLTIRGQLATNASTFTTANGNISSRAVTAASVPWTPGPWTTGTYYNSPDLAALIQEIIAQGGWSSGYAIALIITGSGHRASASFDGSSPNAAELVVTYATHTVSGMVFEDVNYGGGLGRDRITALANGGSARPNARVELYDASGNFVSFTTTNAGGNYAFTGLAPGNYTVRVVNRTVSSARTGYVAGLLPVQTYCANATSGTAISVFDRVGGEVPAKADAGNGITTLAALTTASTAAQSITAVTLGGADITNVDFGFNFDLIVNANDAGQGSLRQFITNANALGNEAALAQSGFRKDLAGANQALPTGVETSVFMISNGTARPGLRAGLPNLLDGSGVALINLSSGLPIITGDNTAVDGTTQTCNVGNTNSLVLGTGGTVGVDALVLPTVPAPEVELRDNAAIMIGLQVQASGFQARGLSVDGFGTVMPEAGILLDSGTGDVIELNLVGTRATTFTDPGAGSRNYISICANGADNGIIRNNLLGFTDLRAIWVTNASDGWSITANELRDNGLNSTSGDGLAVNSSSNCATAGNLITGTSSQGFVVTSGSNCALINNTLTGNGVGITTGHSESAAITMRPGAASTTIDRNIISSNYGAGVSVNNGASGTHITRNSIHSNGTINSRNGLAPSGQIGIDLNNAADNQNLGTTPFRTINDAGDVDAGGNTLLNFPVITNAAILGSNLEVKGFAQTGSSIEFFIADSDPGNFGEGQTFLFTAAEGSGSDADLTTGSYGPGAVNGLLQGTDNAERFTFTVPVPGGVVSGTRITATGTIGGSTSEFSGVVTTTMGPVAVCQNITVALDATGNASITAAQVDGGSTDDVGIVSRSVSPNTFTCADLGPNTVTLTVTDGDGYQSTCIAVVTIQDATSPTITGCPGNLTVNAGATCVGIASWAAPGVTDNCAGASISQTSGPANGSTLALGNYTVVYTATDAIGLTSTCTFTISVVDATPPAITCPADIVVQVAEGVTSAVVTYANATATDNCSSTTVSHFSGIASGGTFPLGNTIVVKRAVDAAGNIAYCGFNVLVMTCPADIIVANTPGLCGANASWDTLTIGYNEGFEDLAFAMGGSGWNPANSTISRVTSGLDGILSASGAAHGYIDPSVAPTTGAFTRMGGQSKCFAGGFAASMDVYMNLSDPRVIANTYGWDNTVSINDRNGVHRRDFIFQTASNPAGHILVGAGTNSSYTRRTDLALFPHYEITASGWYNFRRVYRDQGGVLAVDFELRDAGGTLLWTNTLSNPIDLIAGIGGNRALWFIFLETGKLAVDNAYIIRNNAAETIDNVSGSFFPVGSTTITHTVTTACGTVATCTFDVIVNDTEVPAITCPANITTNVDPTSCSAVVNYADPVVTDNCAGVTIARIVGPASGSTFPPGVTTIAYRATDASGNTTDCSFTITVNPGNDNDGDGLCDNIDLDDDNDGLPDTAEGGNALDSDGDGVPDRFDLDSDNDGIYDVVEAGSGHAFTAGVLNGSVTSSGIPASVDATADNVVDYMIRDSDGDGGNDSQELDADNDGCTDVIEAGYTDANNDGLLGPAPLTVDANGLVTSGNN